MRVPVVLSPVRWPRRPAAGARSRRRLTGFGLLALVGIATAPLPQAGAATAPCPAGSARPWCDPARSPDERAGLLLAAMTKQERIELLGGDELVGAIGLPGTHTGTLRGVSRLGLPTVHLTDGPAGIRSGRATALPAPVLVASSFSRSTAAAASTVLGTEAVARGNDVVLAPSLNMVRTPLGGRTFEVLGEDPYLAGQLAATQVHTLQSLGLIANVKHFAVNNQEGASTTPLGNLVAIGDLGSRFSVDARVDERTLREIYLPAFEATIKEGGALSVMCAYSRVNGVYACENRHLLTDILRDDWGFQGTVIADYGAAYSPARALKAGLNLDIWPGILLSPTTVGWSLLTGAVRQSTVDQRARETLRALFAGGVFDRPRGAAPTGIDVGAHDDRAARIAEDGMVLLRNERAALPLSPDTPGTIAVIGPEASMNKGGGGSSATAALRTTTPLGGLRARFGASRIAYSNGRDRARAARLAKGAAAAIVIVGDRASEGVDKPCLGLNCGQFDQIDRDALIEAVAEANPRTIVVLQTAGPVLTPWRERVAAILEAWYPGQAGGRAIARLIAGDAEPRGHLPLTFPASAADGPTDGDASRYPGVSTGSRIGHTATYSEGVLIGYRWYDAKQLSVAYPFGFGLSYTSWALSNLRIDAGSPATVRVTVTNTGSRTGTAAPQVYVGLPAPAPGATQAPWQLRGFDRVTLQPGASRDVAFQLTDRDLSSWSTAAGDWRIAPGCQRIAVGFSSRDLPLRGAVSRGTVGGDCG